MTIGTNTDDRELLDAYVHEGSEPAFTELTRRHQSMMRASAYRVCGDSEEALDAMQRALISFARRAKEIRADAGAGPWLHRAVTLEAMALRRQRLKRRTREQEAMESQQRQNQSMPPEIAPELDEVINRLPPKDRDAIVLHYFEGRTFRAIAGKLGGTETAWQKRGVRALAKLASALRRRGIVASTTALGAWMVASRAEAGVSAGTLAPMMQEALRHPLAVGVPLKSSPVLFLIMKMKFALALFFAGGVVLSYAWSEDRTRSRARVQAVASTAPQPRPDRTLRAERKFNLEAIATAVASFDSLEQYDPAAASRLRALMFSVPDGYLVAVRDILVGVDHVDRFQPIAAAFYARWAELDPRAAWLAAAEDDTFAHSARRGVLLTWFNIDADEALLRLLENRESGDLAILEEFIAGKSQHDPRDAARLVDRLTDDWPEADRRLFPKVAQAWAQTDPVGAGEWVASYWDRQVRNRMLRQLSQRIARSNGPQGIGLADRIDEPEARTKARINAARWWGVSSGGHSLQRKEGKPDGALSGGFPSEWSTDEVRSFSLGMMANFSKYYPELVGIAKGEEQRQAVYEGVITGVGFSQPALAVDAVESVDSSFVEKPVGKKGLTSFILRWSENDATAASQWLESQPANAKTLLMQEAMEHKMNP